MEIQNKKVVKVDELAPLIPFKAGATFNQLWQVFYYTRLFKYIHRRNYPKIKTAFNKICTDRNLKKLCELGYFKNPQRDIYCATNKVLPILKETDEFPVKLLPNETEGIGNINELNNSGVFVKLTKLPNFYTLLYPDFGYIVPDALLVQLDSKNRKYKLTFLEVEAKKPDWGNYIENKKDNYFKLAHDVKAYTYWVDCCKKQNIPIPDISQFYFSVSFYGSIIKDFGPGFNFEYLQVNK